MMLLDVSGKQVLHENSEAPAIGNGMMNGEDQHMLVRRPR